MFFVSGQKEVQIELPKKNEERRKYGFYHVQIPFRVVSVYPISVPLSFCISLPLKEYKNTPAPAISKLHERILHTAAQGDVEMHETSHACRLIRH